MGSLCSTHSLLSFPSSLCEWGPILTFSTVKPLTLSQKNICLPSLYLHNLVKYQIIHSKLRQRMCSTSFDMDEFLRQIFFSDTFVFLRSVLESLLKRGNRVILACNDSTIGEMEQERLRWFPRYLCVTAHIKPLIKYEGGLPNILVVEYFQLTLSCTQNLKLWYVNGWYHEYIVNRFLHPNL